MEPLLIRPVCYKLPTARRGTPFRPYNAPGQKRPKSCKIRDSDDETAHKISKVENETDMEGDANIEIETSYCWLNRVWHHHAYINITWE